MNNISWLIYASDVIPNVGGIMVFFAVLLGVALVALTIMSFCVYGHYSWNERKGVSGQKMFPFAPNVLKWVVPFFVLTSLLATIFPSKQTILLIATSEFTEEFIVSETGTEVGGLVSDTLKLLKQQINDQLKVDDVN